VLTYKRIKCIIIGGGDEVKFGEKIREKRLFLRKSYRELAEKLEVSASYISDIEKGNRSIGDIELFDKLLISLDLDDKRWEFLYLLCFERNNIELVMIKGLFDGYVDLGG
jgi:transcriptional regulator with XRE-family HTH domain